MGIETGNLISDLNEAWPAGGENFSEGDDHLRFIKHVVKADALPKSGGTMTGALAITDATAASSATTGALKVTGGLSTQGSAYAGVAVLSPIFSSITGNVTVSSAAAGFVVLRPNGSGSSTGQASLASTGKLSLSNTLNAVVSTTGSASINLPHGAAPTPGTNAVNGDLWTTTAGLFAYINGAAVGPFAGATDITGKVSKAGDTMTGPLLLAAGATGGAGLRMQFGVAPTSAQNGDMWIVSGTSAFMLKKQSGTVEIPDTTGGFSINGNWSFYGTPTFRTVTFYSAPGLYAHMNFLPGTPSMNFDGDLWMGTDGVYTYVSGAVVGPLISAASVPVAATATPLMNGTAAVGSGVKWAKEDHVHPTDTSRAAATLISNKITVASSAPSSPSVNDIWIDTT